MEKSADAQQTAGSNGHAVAAKIQCRMAEKKRAAEFAP
jgi:hypothetical protein